MQEHDINPETPLLINEQDKDIKKNELNPNFSFDKLIKDEDLKNEEEQLIKQCNDEADLNLFEVQTANEAIKMAMAQPDPVQLYPPLVLENEITICFADTGAGKTALAFQMAIAIASKGYTTLYLDLELSLKQFQRRYTSSDGTPYELPNNLYRAGFARLNKTPKNESYIDCFFRSLIALIKKTGARVIFLDNLTKLAASDTDTAKATIPIIERLNVLKNDYGLTIIVLEHNKKVGTDRPIQLNDLQGSKMKSNLVDAVFTIGRSANDKNIRYIKQLKVRDGEVIYDTENVKVCELSKDKGYLSFIEISYGSEFEHLTQPTKENNQILIEQAKELKNSGKTQREISRAIGRSLGWVNKHLKK